MLYDEQDTIHRGKEVAYQGRLPSYKIPSDHLRLLTTVFGVHEICAFPKYVNLGLSDGSSCLDNKDTVCPLLQHPYHLVDSHKFSHEEADFSCS